MLRTLFGVVAAIVLVPTFATQVQTPLSLVNPNVKHQRTEGHRHANEMWNLDESPDPNATDHLVFETVHSLLQLWPNTRMRNGHNIVPGIVPKGTLLYHGRLIKELPLEPDWVATDPEHSYVFCRSTRVFWEPEGCWHLTLATTRPLKVVYFDGSSGAKIPYGSMDTQDLIAWGNSSTTHPLFNERQRIKDLCKWGERFGVDGLVRMEVDFEIMLCDFTSGVSVVSFTNLVDRGGEGPSTPADFHWFAALNAGSWHNYFPGETRVQLDLAGLVSFYDTQLAPSLVDIRAGQERWDHRALNISSEDLLAVKSRLEDILTRPEGPSSGIDWRALVHVIADRYAGKLELVRYLLNLPVAGPDKILDLANKTQTQLRGVLTPYLILSAAPTDQSDKGDLNWAIPIYKLCATTHTYSMEAEKDFMTDSEKLILQAVRGTTREICRIVTKMWAAGVFVGIDTSLNTKNSPDIAEITHLWDIWARDLGNLMGWLDWNVWVKCNPSCGLEEMCYLPTWPVGFPQPHRGQTLLTRPDRDRLQSERFRTIVTERLAEEVGHIIKPGPDDWIRPQPRCIRRIGLYDL